MTIAHIPTSHETAKVEIQHLKQISGTAAIPVVIEAEHALHQADYCSPHLHSSWNHQALVAVQGGVIVGILTYEDVEWKNEFWVALGYVKPAFRRRGIYRMLWEALVKRAQEANRPQISGSTSVRNLPMQEAMEAFGRKATAIIYSYAVPEVSE